MAVCDLHAIGWSAHGFHRHTGNEAAKLKLYAEISLLKGDIKSLKEAWGVTCFDLYSQGDANGVNASHAKQLVKIRDKEAKVQAKIVELNKLKAPKEPVVVDSTPIAVPIAEVPPPTQTMAVPVPPDASAPACESFFGDAATPSSSRRRWRGGNTHRDAVDATPTPSNRRRVHGVATKRPRRSPGQQIAVVLPDGKTVQAVVPPNAVPGTVFHIQV